jgi:hypothetical protein
MRMLVRFQKLNISFIRSLHEEGAVGSARRRSTWNHALSLLCRKVAFRTTRIKVGIGPTDCTEGRLLHATFGRLVRSCTLAKDRQTPIAHCV